MGIALARAIIGQLAGDDFVVSEDELETETEEPDDHAVHAMAQHEQGEPYDLDRAINVYAIVTFGMIFVGAALILLNEEVFKKTKKRQ
jgi:hypothetical protein